MIFAASSVRAPCGGARNLCSRSCRRLCVQRSPDHRPLPIVGFSGILWRIILLASAETRGNAGARCGQTRFVERTSARGTRPPPSSAERLAPSPLDFSFVRVSAGWQAVWRNAPVNLSPVGDQKAGRRESNALDVRTDGTAARRLSNVRRRPRRRGALPPARRGSHFEKATDG